MSLASLQDHTAIDQDALRAECDEFRGKMAVSRNAFAQEIGVPPSTFAEWLGGTYRGNSEQVAQKVRKGIEALKDKATARATQPKKAPFLLTQTAKRIEQALEFAHYMPCITAVGMAPGVGKTLTCERYRASKPHVYLVTCEPSTASVTGLLGLIADELEIQQMPVGRLSKAIIDRLKGKDALLIADECQHLNPPALDQLRSLHDKAGCGIALVGNITVYRRLEGGGRGAGFAQIFSRVFKSIQQAAPLKADVDELIGWYGVEDTQVAKYLVTIAKKPGGLRGLTATMIQAQMLAGGAPLTLQHVQAGYAQLSPTVVQNS